MSALDQSNSCTQETAIHPRSLHYQIWYLVKADSWLIEVIFPLPSHRRMVKGYLGPLLWSTNPILNHESPPPRPQHVSKVIPPKTYMWTRLQLHIGSGDWDSNQSLPKNEKAAGGRQRQADLWRVQGWPGLHMNSMPARTIQSDPFKREREETETDRQTDWETRQTEAEVHLILSRKQIYSPDRKITKILFFTRIEEV